MSESLNNQTTGAITPAQDSPLLISSLFETAMALGSKNEILYADRSRYSYATFGARVHRLANALICAGR